MAPTERAPAPALLPYVRRYYGFRQTTGAPLRLREGPGVDVLVLLSFGPGWRIGDAANPEHPWHTRASFVAGLHTSSVLTEHDGESYGMQVSLTPPGAHALFGLPLHELADRTVHLDDVVWARASRLAEQLAELDDWAARFEFLDASLAARVENVRPPSTAVVWAWQRLTETHGCLRVGELADELGWSRKRLNARFSDQVGLSPKSCARLLRFEHAKTLLERGNRPDLGRLALECGYYDQAHLSNEFRRISGTSPAAYATNFQDASGTQS